MSGEAGLQEAHQDEHAHGSGGEGETWTTVTIHHNVAPSKCQRLPQFNECGFNSQSFSHGSFFLFLKVISILMSRQ